MHLIKFFLEHVQVWDIWSRSLRTPGNFLNSRDCKIAAQPSANSWQCFTDLDMPCQTPGRDADCVKHRCHHREREHDVL